MVYPFTVNFLSVAFGDVFEVLVEASFGQFHVCVRALVEALLNSLDVRRSQRDWVREPEESLIVLVVGSSFAFLN